MIQQSCTHVHTQHTQAVDFPLKVSQTAAIMEVVHSMVGLVRSPVGITGKQLRAWSMYTLQ